MLACLLRTTKYDITLYMLTYMYIIYKESSRIIIALGNAILSCHLFLLVKL